MGERLLITEGVEWLRKTARAAAVPDTLLGLWTSAVSLKALHLSARSVRPAQVADGKIRLPHRLQADRTACGACDKRDSPDHHPFRSTDDPGYTFSSSLPVSTQFPRPKCLPFTRCWRILLETSGAQPRPSQSGCVPRFSPDTAPYRLPSPLLPGIDFPLRKLLLQCLP